MALPLLAARRAQAEQFVLVDATFGYTWDDAVNAKPSKSHFYVNDNNFLSARCFCSRRVVVGARLIASSALRGAEYSGQGSSHGGNAASC